MNNLFQHSWQGYPIVHPDHSSELDQSAAINEFQHGMYRAHAEAKAHSDYVKKQRLAAAAHHLQGARAAQAAGDLEAARRHDAMYQIHTKALGFEPTGAVHPDIVGHLTATPAKVYKFKAHHGDLFAAGGGGEGTVTKAEALHSVYKTLEALAKGGVVSDQNKAKTLMAIAQSHPDSVSVSGPDARRYGIEGRVVGSSGHATSRKNPSFRYDDFLPEGSLASGITITQHGSRVRADLNHGYGGIEATRKPDGGYHVTWVDRGLLEHPSLAPHTPHVLRALASHLTEAHKAPYVEIMRANSGRPVWDLPDPAPHTAVVKSEKKMEKASTSACRCDSYHFPHRHGGGKCKGSK